MSAYEVPTATLLEVTYSGSAGSYYDQPEAAEFRILCPLVDAACDAWTFSTPWQDEPLDATCCGNKAHPEHEVLIVHADA